MTRPAWLTARLIIIALGVIALVGALWWLYAAVTAKPRAEASLGRNQAEAAQASGRDAANAVGAASDRESGIDATTRSNEKEIRDAQGANASVDPAVRDAGLRSLCRRASYRRDPKCVQLAPPR